MGGSGSSPAPVRVSANLPAGSVMASPTPLHSPAAAPDGELVLADRTASRNEQRPSFAIVSPVVLTVMAAKAWP